MIPAAALLACFLHLTGPKAELVEKVWLAGGVDAVAMVWMESRFDPQAERIERDKQGRMIGTSFGLYQLFDKYHPQWRGDLMRHIAGGQLFLDECKARTPNLRWAVARYNGSLAWGIRVEAERDELVRWLSWRALRELEVAWR